MKVSTIRLEECNSRLKNL